MKRMFFLALAALPLVLEAVDADFALTVQGMLSEPNKGSSFDRNRTVNVRLYANETAEKGACLWARTYAVTLANDGLFSVTISDREGSTPVDGNRGSCATLLDAVMAAADHVAWVGFEDDAVLGELKPRVRLSCAPRALRAFRAYRPAKGFSVAGELKSASVTANKVEASGNIRTPDVVSLTAMQVGRTLNVGSASVNGSLKVDGTLAVDNTLAVAGDVTAASSKVTAATMQSKTFEAKSCSFTTAPSVTVGGQAPDFPKGAITMWSGSFDSIPKGWKLCDGADGRPDLRDRFIVGAGSAYNVGNTGGDPKVRLETQHMPSHKHTITYKVFGYTPTHRDDLDETIDNMWGAQYVTKSTGEAGGDVPHENRPPYYALYFIQRVE